MSAESVIFDEIHFFYLNKWKTLSQFCQQVKHQKIIQYSFDYNNLVKDNVSCINLTFTYHFLVWEEFNSA
jgi:hypothetical protein